MKQLKRDLQTISKNLNVLTRGVEKMIKAVNKLEHTQEKTGPIRRAAAEKASAKSITATKVVTKKGRSQSATEKVLKIIVRSKKGVDTSMLQKRTGYNSRKIWDIVHRAYKEGKINKLGRGTYCKV